MRPWVLNGGDDMSLPIIEALLEIPACSQRPQVLKPAESDHLLSRLEPQQDVIFFIAPAIGELELEQIQRIKVWTSVDVIVVSPAPDRDSLLKVIRAGATDFLDMLGDLPSELSACLSRIQHHRPPQERRAHTISIVPCHVSSDASILATNLAAAIAMNTGNCGLLDFQLRGGDIALLLKLHPQHSLFDLVHGAHTIDATMFRQALTKHETGIELLAGPELFSDLSGIAPVVCNSIIDLSRSCFSHVVVATEDIQHSEQIYSLVNSDEVILTMRSDVMSLHRAKRHLDFIAGLEIPAARMHVVVFGTGGSGELRLPAIKKVFSSVAVHFVPADPNEIAISINVGNPIVAELPRSKTSQAIVELTTALTGCGGQPTTTRNNYLAVTKTAAALALSTLQFGK